MSAPAVPSNQSQKRRLIAGFGAQGLSLVGRTGQEILLVPLFVTMWGTGYYQDWLILLAAAGFLALGDLGMRSYFGNSILMTWSRGEPARFQRMINIAFGSYAVICSLLLAVSILVLWLVDWSPRLTIASLSDREALLTLGSLALATLVLLPRSVISAIYRARGEFGRSINQETFLYVTTAAGMALALALGASPPVVALLYFLISLLVGWGVVVVDQRRRYPDVRYGIALPSRRELRETVEKSRWYFVAQAAAILVLHAPVLIIGVVGNVPAAVVMFTIARTLTGLVRQLPIRVAEVAGVEMSRHYARHDMAALRHLYHHTGRLVGGISGLIVGLLMAVAEPIILVWTRGQVPYDPWLIAAFLLPLFLVAPAHPGGTTYHYSNLPGFLAFTHISHAILGLLCCLALVPAFGAVGAAAGLAISEILIVCVVTVVTSRHFGVLLGPFLRVTLGVASLTLALSFGIAGTLVFWLDPQTLVGLAIVGASWAILAVGPAIFLMTTPQQRIVLVHQASGLRQRWLPRWSGNR